MKQVNLWNTKAILSLALPLFLAACGGNSEKTQTQAPAAAPMQAAPTSADTQIFTGRRQDYRITKLSVGYIVTDALGKEPAIVIRDKKTLTFSDLRINLEVADLAYSVPLEDLNLLIELYTAFFNRVPDADGLAYWISNFKSGATIDQIADNFYRAAILFSAQTGYTQSMTNDDFVRIVYKNVLGRTGTTAPTDSEVNYWSNNLAQGMTKGHLVRAMLVSARAFYSDLTFSWVPYLLDNKTRVAKQFAINQGISYLTNEESITKTSAIAAAVKPSSTTKAESMIPVTETNFSLALPPSYSKYANVCTPDSEKIWARGHLDDVYLWYKDIVDVPIAVEPDSRSYFDKLLVRSQDRFSFTYSQSEIDSFFSGGSSVSYGYSLLRQGTRLRVLYVQPGSPADLAGLTRGAVIAQVDHTSLAQTANDVQFAALYPSKSETHNFDIVDLGATNSRNVDMTANAVTSSPVLMTKVLTQNEKKFGYMVFNDHISSAEQPLITAINSFSQAKVTDLVLDLRYNGGGYLYIANELSSMIAGAKAADKVFEQLQYNDKHPDWSEGSTEFFSRVDRQNRTLPWLGLSRVYVLTGSHTCSASESIINGLSPFVEVILIGDNTCGKPYGFLQTNNCTTAYFAIQFSGVNAVGNGGYVNGFAPRCKVSDDIDHVLGDPNEARLAAALNYAKTGACPAGSGFDKTPSAPEMPQERDPYPWRSIRLLNRN